MYKLLSISRVDISYNQYQPVETSAVSDIITYMYIYTYTCIRKLLYF